MADYLAAKNAAAAKVGAARPQTAAAPPPAAGVSLYTQVGSTNESQTTGGNRFPPDGDVAAAVDAALGNLDYLVGCNCFGMSWVTQLGARPFLHPHHRPSAADGIGLGARHQPNSVPGERCTPS